MKFFIFFKHHFLKRIFSSPINFLLIVFVFLFSCQPSSENSSESQSSSSNGNFEEGGNNDGDPYFKYQWYLKNTGQYGGLKGIDIDVESVWQQNILGQGMKVGILDSGKFSAVHPDLKQNLLQENIFDFVNSDPNGYHATGVVGIVAARDNNGIGIRGIASRAIVYGYAVVDKDDKNAILGAITKALNRKEHVEIAVYNGSIGIQAENTYMTLPDEMASAFTKVLRDGFHGKGSSLVFSAGNNELNLSSSANIPLNNHYGTIIVNSIDMKGRGVGAHGGQEGENLWICAPTGVVVFQDSNGKMITTDLVGELGKNKKSDKEDYLKDGNYADFGATSGAAPVVTGVVTLLRQAYPNLTWRDVKLILAESAVKVNQDNRPYATTGKMYSNPNKEQQYENRKGFGMIDASAAISLAKNWKLLPTMKERIYSQTTAETMPQDDSFGVSEINVADSDINFIESVVIEINIEKKNDNINFLGRDLVLISPDNKSSFIFTNATIENNSLLKMSYLKKDNKLVLLSNRFLGSNRIAGRWQLKLRQREFKNGEDDVHARAITKIISWRLIIRGH